MRKVTKPDKMHILNVEIPSSGFYIGVKMSEEHILFVRKQIVDPQKLSALVEELVKQASMDAYQTRLSLMGAGLGYLAKGTANELSTAAGILGQGGFQRAVVPARPGIPKAQMVKAVSMQGETLVFETKSERVSFPKKGRAFGVLADFDGRLLSKLMRRMSNRTNELVGLDAKEKYKTIFSANPVLDVYILPESFTQSDEAPIGPFRFIPGKFNATGLGKHATPSARQNMDRVVRLVKGLSSWFALEMDFGLFQMPGCRLTQGDIAGSLESNLNSLSRYGYYLGELYRQNLTRKGQDIKPGTTQTNTASTAPETEKAVMGDSGAGGAVAAVVGIATAAQVNTGMSSQAIASEGIDEPSYKPEDTMTAASFLPSPPEPIQNAGGISLEFKVSLVPIAISLLVFALIVAAHFNPKVQMWLLNVGINRGVLFFLISAGLFYSAFRFLSLKRWMDNTPTSKIRSLAMGMVEVKGICERACNLQAPISNIACVYYRMRRYKKKHSGNKTEWVLQTDMNSGSAPFLVKDETGKVLVNPLGARILPSHSETYRGDIGLSGSLNVHFSPDEKVIEETIPEFAPIYVLGSAQRVEQELSSLSQRTAEKIRELKQDHEKLLREYDADGNGVIDEQEWESARSAMEAKAIESVLEEKQKLHAETPSAVIQKAEVGRLPFVVAGATETGLTRRYKIYSSLMFIGAIGLLVTGMLFLLNVMDLSLFIDHDGFFYG